MPVFSSVRGQQIGRAHVELQSRRDLVCRLLLEKKNGVRHIRGASLAQALMRNAGTCRLDDEHDDWPRVMRPAIVDGQPRATRLVVKGRSPRAETQGVEYRCETQGRTAW